MRKRTWPNALIVIAGAAITSVVAAAPWADQKDTGDWFSAHQMAGDHPHWFASTLHGTYQFRIDFRQNDCSLAYTLNRMEALSPQKRERVFPELQVRVDDRSVFDPIAMLEQDASTLKISRTQFTLDSEMTPNASNAELLHDLRLGTTVRFKLTPPADAPAHLEQRFATIPLNGSSAAINRAQRACNKELSQRDYFD